jgi:PHS family inorganic phosphate transporter-like MFS transporter
LIFILTISGPNTLTYIIPAEIFPTRYRGTCHGIAAASGKLGSVIVQAFLKYTKYSSPTSHNLGWVLIGFSGAMLLGAFFAWTWIPDVQNARGSESVVKRRKERRWRKYEIPSKSLEELAKGRQGVDDDDDDVGVRHRSRLMMRKLGMRKWKGKERA